MIINSYDSSLPITWVYKNHLDMKTVIYEFLCLLGDCIVNLDNNKNSEIGHPTTTLYCRLTCNLAKFIAFDIHIAQCITESQYDY